MSKESKTAPIVNSFSHQETADSNSSAKCFNGLHGSPQALRAFSDFKGLPKPVKKMRDDFAALLTDDLAHHLLGVKPPNDVCLVNSREVIVPANRKITMTFIRKIAWTALCIEDIEIKDLPSQEKIQEAIDKHKTDFHANLANIPADIPDPSFTVSVPRIEQDRTKRMAEWNSAMDYESWVDLQAVNIKLCWIPPGQFQMGSREIEPGRRSDELAHQVILTRGFWFAESPVTQDQWMAVMGVDSNPSFFKGSRHLPVDSASWLEALNYCRMLNAAKPSLLPSGWCWALPTEAQWEYACRTGGSAVYNSNFESAAWYDANSGDLPQPVASKEPNTLGLYDMHGNIMEWCRDWYGEYPRSPVTDPRGPLLGQSRVSRGGSWASTLDSCRAASRSQTISARPAKQQSDNKDVRRILGLPASGPVNCHLASTGFRLAVVEACELETIWYQNRFDDPIHDQRLLTYLLENMNSIIKGTSQYRIVDCASGKTIKKKSVPIDRDGMLRLANINSADEIEVAASSWKYEFGKIWRDILFSRIAHYAFQFRKMVFETEGI